MKRFQAMRFLNVPVVVDVICNKCGESCRPHAHAINFEHANVDVSWGYDSGKDGDHDHWDVCERCYDEIVATFKLPPTKRDYMSGERQGTFEEHGWLHRIPAYPRVSLPRTTDDEFIDFREGVEKAAQARGYQEGARSAGAFGDSDIDLMWQAVSRHLSDDRVQQCIPDDQREAWLDLDNRLTTMLNNRRPKQAGGKDRPDGE